MLFKILYNLLITALVILTLPMWLVWLIRVPKIRAGFWEKCGFYTKELKQRLKNLPEDNRIWLHAVSVGELNAAKPLISRFQAQRYLVILSCTTLTGYTLAKNSYPETPVLYFPFDFIGVMREAFRLLSPKLAIVMETEIWPNYLFAARERKVPVVLVNGRLSEKSFQGYGRFKWFLKPVLSHYSKLLMQSEGDAARMMALGAPAEKVRVTGNIKFDTPPFSEITDKIATLKACIRWAEDAQIVTFASTHPGEEEIMLEIYQHLKMTMPQLKAILAPRHPERAEEVGRVLAEHGQVYARRSQLSPEHPAHANSSVLLLDTIGELMAAFSISRAACMGGTFVPWGGHNPLEPIMTGIPVVFGPSMKNFKDIAHLVCQAKAGIQVENATEAWAHLEQLLINPQHRDAIVHNGKKLLHEHQGVTENIFDALRVLLDHP